MNAVMPTMLAWVLGGNDSALRSADRQPHCRLEDKPKTFDEKVLPLCLAVLSLERATIKMSVVTVISAFLPAQVFATAVDRGPLLVHRTSSSSCGTTWRC